MNKTKTKKQSTPAEKPKSIPDKITELKQKLFETDVIVKNNINFSRTKYNAKEYTDAFVIARKQNQKEPNIEDFIEEPAQPVLAFYSQFNWLSGIKSIGTLTEQLIFDVELNGEGKQDAKTLVSAFRLAFLRLKKTCETKPIDLLGVRENIRKYKELLETAQAHFAEPKIKPELQDNETQNDEKINSDNPIFNSSQFTDKNDTPITLREFFKEYCKPLSTNLTDRRVEALQGLSQKKKLKPPLKHIGEYIRGESKYYKPSILKENWPKYQEQLTGLPDLK